MNSEILRRTALELSAVGIALADITPETRLKEDLGLDSLQLAVLTVKIESEFGLDLFADGIINSIGDAEQKIEDCLRTRKS